MPGCCAVSCRNRTEDGKKLFAIPQGKANDIRRKVWLRRIGRKNFTATGNTRLCEDHFTVDQFEPLILAKTGEKKLKFNAVPSIFSHRPVEKTRKPPCKRLREDSPVTTTVSVEAETTCEVESIDTVSHEEDTDTCNDASTLCTETPISGPENALTVASTHAALLSRIQQLEDQVQSARRRLNLAHRQRCQALLANKRIVARLNKFLNDDQLKCLEKLTMKGVQWSKKTVIKALKVRLSCGKRGYSTVKELGQPLPSERTLQRHLEMCKFEPGLLNDIMRSLAMKVDLMSPEEHHATLMLDEIQLSPGLVYDPSSGSVLGSPTIPLADGTLPANTLATHGLVFMLGGISTRWKQTIAYHLSGNSFHAQTAKDFIVHIIKECEAIFLKVDVIVTDMGGGNQGLLKLFGIIVGKHSKRRTWCPHPCDSTRKLHFMADCLIC
ncbi:uncharacterized protein LOC135389575 [Ornithodoros turicata]|uniref:uncharacterized protein LOC135389575 n=1 Tax=Ornithodoros turicata TaxID=34597 RepID=UPI003138E823